MPLSPTAAPAVSFSKSRRDALFSLIGECSETDMIAVQRVVGHKSVAISVSIYWVLVVCFARFSESDRWN